MRRRRNFRKGGRPRRFHEGGATLMPGGNPNNPSDWMMLLPHDHPHAPGGPYPSSLPGIVPGHLTPGSIYSTSTAKRFENEMIRHKVLDVLGDFYLLGYPIIAKISCVNSGHKTNNMVLKELLNERFFDILIPNKNFTKKSAIYST